MLSRLIWLSASLDEMSYEYEILEAGLSEEKSICEVVGTFCDKSEDSSSTEDGPSTEEESEVVEEGRSSGNELEAPRLAKVEASLSEIAELEVVVVPAAELVPVAWGSKLLGVLSMYVV